MERISAQLHTSIGSFPSSSSLTGFLTSSDDISPIKTYPLYVAGLCELIILNEAYKMEHRVLVESEIKHISCFETKIAISTLNDVRIMQKYGDELRTLCILDEDSVYNSCFFLNGNGLCITKRNKITLYAVTDIINRYHAQLDAIEKAKEKLKKQRKIGKGLESGATTPKSILSEMKKEEKMDILYDLKEDDSEIDMDLMMDDDIEEDINALIVRYRTIYIDTKEKQLEWSISQLSICCGASFWWIAMIDNMGLLHVIKLIGEWPSTMSLSDIISTHNTQHIELWINKCSNNDNKWLIGIWSLPSIRNNKIKWYKSILIVLDENGNISLWNEPHYNYILSSLSSADENHFIFRCILSLNSLRFVGFECIDNILCDLQHFNASITCNDNDYLWLLTLDSFGTMTVYFIQNIALFECGKASLIKFTEIVGGIIYRLRDISLSVCFAFMLDPSRGITVSSSSSDIVSSPTLIELYTFFKSGILAHFSIDLNDKNVICNRMFGGILPNDECIECRRHPSLRYNIFAALTKSRRLSVFDYSQNLDSINCNDAPKLIYIVPFKPILSFAWDQYYRRLICINKNNAMYYLSIHVYKSKHGWNHVYKTPISLNVKQKIISMIIAPELHHRKRTKRTKSNMIIITKETSWSAIKIDIDKLAKQFESTTKSKDKEQKSSDSNKEKIIIINRQYAELKAHRDRIRRRPPSEAPNSLYQWKKSDRRPAPLVVRSVKVDKELYQSQPSFTTEMLAAVIGEEYGGNKRLISCSGFACNDRVILICIFDDNNTTSCCCYTIYDNAKHDISPIIINNDKITKCNPRLLRSECLNSSRIMLIHETEGIMLYERQSSSLNEWIFEVWIPHSENNIELVSMMMTAGGSCIATAKHNLGSVQLLFPVLSDLSTTWDHDAYYRTFKLHDLVMDQLESKEVKAVEEAWPQHAVISSFVFLSPTILLLYRTDIHEWIIVRISTAAVAGWPGRTLYHPLALYQDMKCSNFKRIHRILKDFLMVLRRVPEEQYGTDDMRSRFLVPINWLLDCDEETTSHLQFDASADYYLKPSEVNELHDLLQKIKLPMVSRHHNLTLLALTQTLRSVQEQQRNVDIPGAQFMYAANLFKLQRTPSVPLGCIAWATHSHSQDALSDLCIPKNNISYDTYKHLGIAYWVRNTNKLRELVDKLAMAIYRRTKNPTESTLWYILLNKKRILVSLLKISRGKEKVHRFMSRDFSILRNQNAARQNAVSLTSKHKFMNACAFWILAGNYEPAINVALQNLDDPHLALLMARLLWQNKGDDSKYEEILNDKILCAVKTKYHNNIWEQHMILWLLKRPKESVNVLLNNSASQMSDAPEIYAFVKYLKENEIVKSVREKQSQTSGAIFASPLFADMADFDYSYNKTVNEDKNDDIKSPFEPKAYDLCSKEIDDDDLTSLLLRAAVSYSRCGLLIHALESVETVSKRLNKNHVGLAELQSNLLWRFLCVRSSVMESSHHIEPEQTKDDFADLSARFPKFDALLTLNYLYGECHLRGYMIHSCNIPSGPTLTRLLIVLSRSISHLTHVISHRNDRFNEVNDIFMLQFIKRWENVVDDVGLLGKERKIAIAAIAAIIHCGVFLKMFGLNRYDIIEDQICKSSLSPNLQSIITWFNADKLNNDDYLDDEYVDNIKYLKKDKDMLWSNHTFAHGPMELLAIKTFRFTILERFIFLWRKLLKKIGYHASHFIDLGTLYTQLTSWLLQFAGDLQHSHQMAIVYCLENKIERLDHITNALTKYNSIAKDEKRMSIYNKLEMDLIMDYFVSKLKLFRLEHNEEKEWYPPYDIFKIDGDLPSTVSYNKCDNEWIVIATNNGLREISMDCSLRFRLRSEDGTNIVDAEYDNYTECLLRFRDIGSPKHTEIFGPSPFGGSGDIGHCKPYSISTSNTNKINENAKPYPISPLLPRIQLRRYPQFVYNNKIKPKISASSPHIIPLTNNTANTPLSLRRKPSQIYFQSFDDVSNPIIQTTFSDIVDKEEQKGSNASGIELKKTLSGSSSSRAEPQPAVTSTLKCNLFNGFSSYKLYIPLFYCCLEMESISSKRRSLSNTYRFYWRVISQQNAENTSSNNKEIQISDRDLCARNDTYLIIANHPSLPLYISSNTKSDGMRLWHYHHEYPLASFSLPLSSTTKSNPSIIIQRENSVQKMKTAPTSSRSATLTKDLKQKTEQKQDLQPQIQKKVSSQNDYMTALKFNGFGNKIAGISQNGNLYLWHFNVPRSIFRREFRAYYEQHCHDKFGNDLVFVSGSSCIATAGESSNNYNVCIWDLLFCDRSRSLIRSYSCYEGNGANCIEFARDIDALIVGGYKGVCNMFDKRIPFPILKWIHGQSRIWKLSYYKNTKQLLVATLDGLISIYDIRKLYHKSTLYTQTVDNTQLIDNELTEPIDLDSKCIVKQWKLFHRKNFLNHTFGAAHQLGYLASVGLTDAIWTNNGDILCTGSDGTVKYIKRKTNITLNL